MNDDHPATQAAPTTAVPDLNRVPMGAVDLASNERADRLVDHNGALPRTVATFQSAL